MPADPSKELHANRSHSVPTLAAGDPQNCFSRSDILTGKTPAAFGSAQSAAVCSDGESTDDPATWPKLWPKKGRLLRVPKCVILSSFPQWTAYWPKSYFFFPRDVIGDTGLGFLGNYYYFDQWNTLDPVDETPPDYSFTNGYDLSNPTDQQTLLASDGYKNNRVWDNMQFLDEADKYGVYNAYVSCVQTGGRECASIPPYLFNKCPTDPPPSTERYFQSVGNVTNPYYQIHNQLLNAFLAAKQVLESDPVDPIYVIIPNWQPPTLRQVRNAYLKQTHEMLNPAHGGAVNGQPCGIVDVDPCYTHVDICWAPPYPNINDPRNYSGFNGPAVPWLMSTDPGFGTNALHLYVGHPNMSYGSTRNFYDYQAWPLTPEWQWIAGPIATGEYLGDSRPFFAGRRVVWRMFGYDYGYGGPTSAPDGAQKLWDNVYSGIVGPAGDAYKTNFWKFRNLTTKLFTYDAQWLFNWNMQAINGDRRDDCPATQFYFGFDFPTFANEYISGDPADNQISDCFWHDNIRTAETYNYFPGLADINAAIGVGNALTQRVQDYYQGIEPGSAAFYQIAIDKLGLKDYNVSYEGPADGTFFDVDALVAYIRAYFKENR